MLGSLLEIKILFEIYTNSINVNTLFIIYYLQRFVKNTS